jgi:protocatechuate 3,4-dioxygenase beta subunit
MRNLTEKNATEAVLARLAGCRDERTRALLSALIRHLHEAVREAEPTPAEWLAAIEFLTDTGKMCDEKRQEFILLSDTLGISTLVDAINNRKGQGSTESSLLGPFYVPDAPERAMGANLAGDEPGALITFRGRVRTLRGEPIVGATLEVWQTAPNGLYDIQDPAQPAMNLRGTFRTGDDGRYELRTLRPVSYPVPTDGPVGRLLRLQGRHPYRPAHTHFMVSASGFRRLVTELFIEGDAYLDSDAVFGVKDSLVVAPRPDGTVEYDFVLEAG